MVTTIIPRRRRRSRYNLRPNWLTTKRIVAMVALATVAVGGTYAFRVIAPLAKLTHENPFQVVGELIGGGKGSAVQAKAQDLSRINIAVYGYGGVGHDGAYLTDSIMVVSLQPRSGGLPPEVAEISIPRDWYVPISLKNGQVVNQRVNFAYAAGMNNEGPVPADQPGAGAAVANPTVGGLLGIHIDHYVGVDFDAFKQAVDAVGGVDVNVSRTFTDYQYPAGECGGYNSNCGFMVASFTAGVQHMDGTRALIFSRSRHGNNGEGSDFARSARQQLVVAALKQKVLSIGGLGHLPDLLGALGDNVSTDLKVDDMKALYELVKNVDPATVEHVSLADTNFLYECGYPVNCGAYYLYAHDRTLASLWHFVKGVFVDPAALNEKAPVTIQDGSAMQLGASARWGSIFNGLGLTTTDGGPVALSATTQVIDNSGGKYAATAKWLANYFGVKVTTLPAPSPPKQTVTTSLQVRGVTVILGADEEHAFNNLNGNSTN